MRKHLITNEEKVAVKLSSIFSDVRLDLELIGVYLARLSPAVTHNRLQIIAESAQAEKEAQINGYNQYTLF